MVPPETDGQVDLQVAVGCGDEVFAAGGNILDGAESGIA
jgi:hypothetical protein